MEKFIEIVDIEKNIKRVHNIPKDNIGEILTEEDAEQLKYVITIVDKSGKEIFSKKFKDAYEFDRLVERIMKQVKESE